MRKLLPIKAIVHALNSVLSYRRMALRIAMVWFPVLLIANLIEFFAGPPAPEAQQITPQELVEIFTGIVSVLSICSVAVSWHRYILRDETTNGLRLDGSVLRYAGNTILIMLAMLVPMVVLLLASFVSPAAAVLVGLPVVVLFGGVVTRLSVKLPAVALNDRGFTFRSAWAATEGNFWPCVGVFLLTWAITLATVLVLLAMAGALNAVSGTLGQLFLVVGTIPLQLFYAIFNASVFTSLYGFFVERREF